MQVPTLTSLISRITQIILKIVTILPTLVPRIRRTCVVVGVCVDPSLGAEVQGRMRTLIWELGRALHQVRNAPALMFRTSALEGYTTPSYHFSEIGDKRVHAGALLRAVDTGEWLPPMTRMFVGDASKGILDGAQVGPKGLKFLLLKKGANGWKVAAHSPLTRTGERLSPQLPDALLGTTVVANVTPALAERKAAHNVHVQTLQGAKWKLGGQVDEPKENQKEAIVDFTVDGPRRSGRKRKPVVPLVSLSPPSKSIKSTPRKG